MRKLKLKITVKMRKSDSFKENNDVDYNDDEYEDIGKVRELKIGQEDEENEDGWNNYHRKTILDLLESSFSAASDELINSKKVISDFGLIMTAVDTFIMLI